jgi:hypothetical protein
MQTIGSIPSCSTKMVKGDIAKEQLKSEHELLFLQLRVSDHWLLPRQPVWLAQCVVRSGYVTMGVT